jgi:hypothetical protein
MARITRKEDKANCLSLGELCSSQLVQFVVLQIQLERNWSIKRDIYLIAFRLHGACGEKTSHLSCIYIYILPITSTKFAFHLQRSRAAHAIITQVLCGVGTTIFMKYDLRNCKNKISLAK